MKEIKGCELPDWAVDWTFRSSGLVENVCKHGVGHPNADWLKKHDPDGKKLFSIHGCCGCCHDKDLSVNDSI